MNPSAIQIWFLAIRPKTLWAAVSPVLIGTAMAFKTGGAHWSSAFAALLGALLIQIGTNLANDYFDFQKGADHGGRVGPMRVTQAGLVKPQTMNQAIALTFALTVFVSAYLVLRGGWPIVVIGVLSILSGIFYTAGRYPLGYLGLGELFVFIFFGPVAVGGTYYVQTLNINWIVVIAGLAPGLLSVAILTVNNLRDIDSDRKAGKKTLAVRFGHAFARGEYLASIIGAFIIPIVLVATTGENWYCLSTMVLSFFAALLIQKVFKSADGPTLNGVLADTGKLTILYSVVFSLGWVL